MSDFRPGPGRESWDVARPDFTRVIALSDGLFAFSLTLLAVNIMPAASDAPRLSQDLAGFLWEMRRLFAVYGLAFLIVFAKWNGHRRLVDALILYDHRLLQLNMVFLFFIAAMPLPAYVIGTQGDQFAAVVFFAGYQMATTVVELTMWHYATARRRLVAPDLPIGWIHLSLTRLRLMLAVFAASMLVALVDTAAAEYSWLLLLGIQPLAERLSRHGDEPRDAPDL